ncbi:hypothetical protein PEC730217_17820 [Pectobacterium carotovorum subsp. carotovorum]|nr:Hypothetical protein SCC1_2759 [Pectobacterium versatile]RUR91805.1 hypothetical protein PB16LOC_02424 [Pectobacterium versatile]GKW33002.1 hypothetical protein PEC730217_17820 [Pectobacterium carotovorum subsp. carotovorum]
MPDILVRHPVGRCYATLKNAPCVFLCVFVSAIMKKTITSRLYSEWL